MEEQIRKSKLNKTDIAFGICVLVILPFLLWKSIYGYGGGDESFYITLAKRFANGDVPLCDEWNLAQLSGLLLMPFYWLHEFLFGSTEGIILHFRYFYIFMHLLTTIGLYICLRKHGLGALLGTLIFYIYTPYDLMALSYNTMGIGLFALFIAILVREKEKCEEEQSSHMNHKVMLIIAGLCYGGSVLCNPYLVLAYFALAIVEIILLIVKKKKPVRLLFISIGVAVPAIYVALLVLPRAPLSEVLTNLSHMLNDPEHESSSLYGMVYTYFYSIITTYQFTLLLWLIALVLSALDRKRKTFGAVYFGVTVLICIMQIVAFTETPGESYNLIMFPMMLCGISACVLNAGRDKNVFFYFYGFGLLFTICACMSSNQGINVICQGMPILLLASSIMVVDYAGQLKQENRFTIYLMSFFCILLFAAQFGTQIYMKSVHAFWEPPVSELKSRIEEGPLAGVLTSAEHAAEYEALLSDLKQVKAVIEKNKASSSSVAGDEAENSEATDPLNNAETYVLAVTSHPWSYLYLDERMGVYSAWISSTYSKKSAKEVLTDRLKEYYTLHEERIPAYAYVSSEDMWNFDEGAAAPQDKYDVTKLTHGELYQIR